MAGGIYSNPAFLDASACRRVRRAMDRGLVEAAEVLREDVQQRPEIRRATLIDIDATVLAEVERRLDLERDRIGRYFGLQLAGREGAGLLRYTPGSFYRPHRDRAEVPAWPEAARRAITAVLMLNTGRDDGSEGEFEGGILRLHFDEGSLDIRPREGLLVAFPADLLHEVTDVRHGVRDSVVDWYYDGEAAVDPQSAS